MVKDQNRLQRQGGTAKAYFRIFGLSISLDLAAATKVKRDSLHLYSKHNNGWYAYQFVLIKF